MRTWFAVLLLASCQSYSFAPITVGQKAEKVPRPRSNSQFVRLVYADLVGRAPAQYEFVVRDAGGNIVSQFPVDEQQLLLDTLDGMGDPSALRDLIVAGLCDSTEVSLPEKFAVADPAAFITTQFHNFLGREPTAYELNAFVTEWKSDDAVNPKTVVRALLASREYQSY
jgi:hypothetical protein